jgi:hypothetical protein
MEKTDTLPIGTRVMAPLGDVLYPGVIAEREGHTSLEGMVCVQFAPPVTIVEPSGSIIYMTCSASDLTQGWF